MHIPRQILKGASQLQLLEQRLQRVLQMLATAGIVGPVSGDGPGLRIFQILRADGRAHKDEVVVKVRAVQDLGGDRVEKSFGQLGLQMIHHQPDIVQLDLLPDGHALLAGFKLLFQPLNAGTHLQVIKRYTLALRALLTLPVHGFKALLGSGSLRTEHAVVLVETMHQGLCNGIGLRGVQSLRKHGGPVAPKQAMRSGRPDGWRLGPAPQHCNCAAAAISRACALRPSRQPCCRHPPDRPHRARSFRGW